MINLFKNREKDPSGPARDMFAVTPSDSVNFDKVAISLRVTGAGDVSIVTERGSTVTVSMGDNSILPCAAKRVNATGTTATGIHGFLA